MQLMPGMTQQQRSAAGDSWRQFQTRLFGNRGQNVQTPAGQNPATLAPVMQPPGKTLKGPTSSPAPTKAPDMEAYKPPIVGSAPNGRPVTGAYGNPQPQGVLWDWRSGPFGGMQGMVGRASAANPQLPNGGYPNYAPQPPAQSPRVQELFQSGAIPPYAVFYSPPSSPAQPIQPQPQGTPYNPMQPMVFETMSERTTRRQPDAPPPTPRPSEFQTTMTGFDGRSYDPQQFFAQRDAFIQRLNEERGRQSAQSGVYGRGEIPQFYQPSRDFGAMWGQAGDMVRGGWTNPLAGLFG